MQSSWNVLVQTDGFQSFHGRSALTKPVVVTPPSRNGLRCYGKCRDPWSSQRNLYPLRLSPIDPGSIYSTKNTSCCQFTPLLSTPAPPTGHFLTKEPGIPKKCLLPPLFSATQVNGLPTQTQTIYTFPPVCASTLIVTAFPLPVAQAIMKKQHTHARGCPVSQYRRFTHGDTFAQPSMQLTFLPSPFDPPRRSDIWPFSLKRTPVILPPPSSEALPSRKGQDPGSASQLPRQSRGSEPGASGGSQPHALTSRPHQLSRGWSEVTPPPPPPVSFHGKVLDADLGLPAY